MSFLALTVLIDWTNSGVWVDESAYVHTFSYARGRATINDVFGSSSATLTLRNASGRFSPYNPSSPLFPNVVGNRPVRVSATYQGTVYAQWAGYTDDFSVTELLPSPTVTLQCVDAFGLFARSTVSIGLVQNKTTDALIAALLSQYGWAGGSTLESGQTLALFNQGTKNTLQALQDIARNELGGALFMGKNGGVIFQNAGHRAASTSTITLSGLIENNLLRLRQTDLVDRVAITYATAYLGTNSGTLYSGQVHRQLPAQSYTTITDALADGDPSTAITPVAGTDWTAADTSVFNPNTRGGPLDVSSNLWLETFTVSGGNFTATFYNSLPYTVTLTSFQVRGTGLLVRQQNPPVYDIAVASPQVMNQPYQLTVDWVTDLSAITAFATARANALGTQHPRPVVTVVGRSDALMAFILGVDLSQRITLVDNAGPWQSGLSGDFFVEHIALNITPGQIPTAQLTLFDTVQGTPA